MRHSFSVDARLIDRSGIGRYIREVLDRVPGFRRASISVYASELASLEGFTFIRDTSRLYGLAEQFSRSRVRTSVIWTPHYNFPIFANGEHVVTVHDLAHLALPEIFGTGLKRFYAKFYFYWLGLRARHVFFVSGFTAREFPRLVGFSPNSSQIIHNGVAPFWFEGDFQGEFSRESNTVLLVGNVKPHKNLGAVFRALSEAGATGGLEIWVVGRAEGFLTGENALLGNDMPWVRWLGEVSDDELRKLYKRAGCFVMPSLYEGFGLPVLEAMAAGCPVAVSDIGALKEICAGGADGEIAEFFDPQDLDSIRRAINQVHHMSYDSFQRRLTNARAHARGFSWDSCATKTLDALAGLELEFKGSVV